MISIIYVESKKGDTSKFACKTRVIGRKQHGYHRVRGGKREIVRSGLTCIH